MEYKYHVHDSDSYQNREHEISIPLDCFVAKDYFLGYCDDCTAIALVGRGPEIHKVFSVGRPGPTMMSSVSSSRHLK